MKKWLRNRKAVSPVIAALLLIAISVAAAVITYSWVMTMIDSQGSQAQTQIRFEDVQFDNTSGVSEIIIAIRNGGGVVAQLQTLYIYDGDTRIVKKDDIGYAIDVGALLEVGFSESDTWKSAGANNLTEPDLLVGETFFDVEFITDFVTSHAYTIRLVTDNGFTIEGTYYSPSSFT